MFENKTILAVIAARGGSKGVPRKNIKMVGGKPLIGWMIEAAKGSSYIDRLILSSDDNEIITIATDFGCDAPFLRPKTLAADDSSISDVILHALEEVPGYDYVMLLQPTSPLTHTHDLDKCIEFTIASRKVATVSVTEPDKSPFWMFKMDEKKRLEPLMGNQFLNCRRQELPSVYIPSGAFYFAQSQWFQENRSFYSEDTTGYIVPAKRSIDIDTQFDFHLLEVLLKHA